MRSNIQPVPRKTPNLAQIRAALDRAEQALESLGDAIDSGEQAALRLRIMRARREIDWFTAQGKRVQPSELDPFWRRFLDGSD